VLLPVRQEKNTKTGILLLSLLFAAVAFAGKSADEELLALESQWSQFLVDANAAALEKLYAGEYLFTDLDGQTYTRAQDIGATRSGEFKMTRFKLDGLKVHVYKDFAVVTGLNDFSATYKGQDASCKCRFTDVFVKRDGRWQVLATQSTKVAAN
jgi:ketosteroid isomerase-like protein